MAPTTFTLVSVPPSNSEAFLLAVKSLDGREKPLWLGNCHHWIHQPRLSLDALYGPGPEMRQWNFLLVFKSSTSFQIPIELIKIATKTWSIIAEVADDQLRPLHQTHTSSSSTTTSLPPGWSPSNHSALNAAIPPPDLEASLALKSQPMGTNPSQTSPLILKDFIRSFGTSTHQGPVAMFNLLSYLPGKREQYFKYVAAFQESVGSNYGGAPIFVGLGVTAWSSQEDEEEEEGLQEGRWEDTALIYYPSLWHFGAMLSDDAYAEADRAYKQGILRDNPILCCTEVSLDD